MKTPKRVVACVRGCDHDQSADVRAHTDTQHETPQGLELVEPRKPEQTEAEYLREVEHSDTALEHGHSNFNKEKLWSVCVRTFIFSYEQRVDWPISF